MEEIGLEPRLNPDFFGNMANEKSLQNLIPNSERTKEELQEMSRKGGIASGEARRERKEMRESLQMLLDAPASNGTGETNMDASMAALVEQMKDGNVSAIKAAFEILNNGKNVNLNNVGRVFRTREEAQAFLDELLRK